MKKFPILNLTASEVHACIWNQNMDGMNGYPSNFGPCRGMSSISIYAFLVIGLCLDQGDMVGYVGLAFFNNPAVYIVILPYP